MSCWWVAVSAKIINDISARFSLPLCPTGFPKLFKWNGKRNAQMEINSVGCGRETTRYVYVYALPPAYTDTQQNVLQIWNERKVLFFSLSPPRAVAGILVLLRELHS